MNKNLFCILYNEAKGGWIVARESAFAKGAARYCGCIPMLLRCAGALLAALNPTLVVMAQVAAAPDAPAQNRPVVGAAANGTTLVQIAAPNAAGLSNNHYTQFNVGPGGVILNNATSAVLTQQGGVIGANTHLSAGSAGVILNQVLGTHPSLLTGFIEVGGQRADVIIANPNGIVCNGGGFINAGRGVLTTGTPLLGLGGSLDGFRVSGGLLEIGPKGLDARTVDQVDLLARGLKVNGQILAGGTLNVVTGPNLVAYAGPGVQVLPGAAGKETVGIDVGLLGGMYAGKICLLGTEAGVGVNSQGTLAAQGGFTCTQEGRIILTGRTLAGGDLSLEAKDELHNQGTLYALGSAALTTQGALRNTGTLGAQNDLTLRAAAVEAKGTLGAGVDSEGQVTRPGHLKVTADGRLEATGIHVAGGHLTFAGAALSLPASTTSAGGDLTLTANGGDLDHRQGARLKAQGAFRASATGALLNDKSEIRAKQVSVDAAGLSNRGGTLVQTGEAETRLGLKGTFDNTGGTFASAAKDVKLQTFLLRNGEEGRVEQQGPGLLTIRTAQVDNGTGLISSKGDAGIVATGEVSSAGLIRAEGTLSLQGATITNDHGWIVALGPSLSLVAAETVKNAGAAKDGAPTGGVIHGRGTVALRAPKVENTGTALAGPRLEVQARALTNSGALNATGRLEAKAEVLTNAQGTLNAPTVALEARLVDNNRGQVTAHALDVTATDLINAGGALTHLGEDGLALKVAGTLTNTGQIHSKGRDLTLKPLKLDNRGGTVTHAGAGTLALRLGDDRGSLDNTGGKITTVGALDLGAGRLVNRGGTLAAAGKLEAGTLSGELDNREGGLLEGGQVHLDAGRGVFHNQGGTVRSRDGVTIHAGRVDNDGGTVTNLKAAPLAVTVTGALDNGKGTIDGFGETRLKAETVKNSGGRILSSTELTVRAASIDTSGLMAAGQGLTLHADQTVANSGKVEAVAVQVEAATLTNSGDGTLLHRGAGPMTLKVAGTLSNRGLIDSGTTDLKLDLAKLDNSRGTIATRGQVDLSAGSVDNQQGTIHGAAGLKVASAGELHNEGGALRSDGRLDLKAALLDNTGGAIVNSGAGTLRIEAPQGLENKKGLIKAGADLDLVGDHVTVDGTIVAGRDAKLDLKRDYTNPAGNLLTVERDLSLTTTGTYTNAGSLVAPGEVTVKAAVIHNHGSARIDGKTSKVTAAHRLVNEGRITGEAVSLEVAGGSFENKGGTVEAKTALNVTATDLLNTGGELTHRGTEGLTLEISGTLANTGKGLIQSRNQDLTLKPGKLDNLGGTITHAGTGKLSLQVGAGKGALDNTAGTLSTGGTLDLRAGSVDNRKGTLFSAAGLQAESGGKLDNTGGLLSAGTTVHLKVARVDNTTGGIGTSGKGAGSVRIETAEGLDNQGGLVKAGKDLDVVGGAPTGEGALVAGQDVNLDLKKDFTNLAGNLLKAERDLKVATTGTLTNAGNLTVPGKATVAGTVVHNQGRARIDGKSTQVTADQKLVNEGRIAGETVKLQAAGAEIVNKGGTVEANHALKVTAAVLGNQGGVMVLRGSAPEEKTGLEVTVQKLDNSGGLVRNLGGQALTVTAPTAFLNGRGELYSLGKLTVTADRIVNTHGQLLGSTTLDLHAGGALENEGGTLEGRDSLVADAKGALTNAGGLITSQGQVTVRAAELRNTQGGQLRSSADLTLSGVGKVENSGGTVHAQGRLALVEPAATVTNTKGGRIGAAGDVTLSVASLDNSGGELGTAAGGSGDVQVTAAGVVSLAQGRLVSARDLTLTAGSVAGAGEIASGNDATLALKSDGKEASASRITAKRNLTLTADQAWSNAGSLQAPGTVTVKGDALRNQDAGVITGGTLRLTGTRSLTNEGKGRILGETVTLHSDQELVNDGTVAAAGTARLTSKGALRNPTGTLSAGRDLELDAHTIDAKGHLGAGLDGEGKAVHAGNLTVTANGGTFKVTGQSLAGGNITFSGPDLTLPGATTQALGNITLNAKGGTIDHQGGKLHAQGALKITAANLSNRDGGTLSEAGKGDNTLDLSGKLDNTAGTITSNAGNLTIASGSLENDRGGKLHHAGQGLLKLVQTGALQNAGGTLATNGEASLTAKTVSNEAGVLTAKKAITVVGTQDLRNVKGVIEAGAGLDLSGSTVTNDGGRLVAFGGQARIKNAAEVNNAGGLISGSTDTVLQAGRINNAAGTIVATRELSLQDTKELNNSGTLSAGGTLKAHAGLLNNAGGRMTATTLDLKGDRLDNRKGELTAAAVSGTATDLHNAAGKLTHLGAEPMAFTVTGALTNTGGGQIWSNGNLALQPRTLDNSGGTIAHAGTGTLILNAGQGSAALTNKAGTIASKGELTVVARDLDNGKGTLQGAVLDIRAGGTLTNEGGTLEAKGNLAVTSEGALNNAAGRIRGGADVSGSTLQVTAASLDNAGGVLGSQGSVTITTTDLKNTQNGQLAAGGNLTLATPKLDNTGGKVHTQGNLDLGKAGGTVTNVRGELSAAGDVTFNLASLANTDGSILAGQNLDFTAQTLPADGALKAGLDAKFTLKGDFTLPDGKALKANRNLTLTTTGNLTNAGSLEAVGRLELGAANITNRGSGLMCGDTTHVLAAGDLGNFGKIYGDDIALSAKAFTNGELGMVSRGETTGSAGSLKPTPCDTKEATGVVAAHRSLHLGAGTISNGGKASLLSGGKEVVIGGTLDGKYRATGEAKVLFNYGATIQAVDGDLRLSAAAVNNLNKDFTTVRDLLEPPRKVNLYTPLDLPCKTLGKTYEEWQLKPADWGPHGARNCWYSAAGDFKGPVQYWEGHIDIDAEGRGHFTHYTKTEVTRTVTGTIVASTVPGQILAGGNLYLAAGSVNNDRSRIIAGKAMPVLWKDLKNADVKGSRVTTDVGIQYLFRDPLGTRRDYKHQTTVAMEVAASVRRANTVAPMPVPATTARAGSGPVVVPGVQLFGKGGTIFPESSAPSQAAIQPAATGQPQSPEAVPALPGLSLPAGGLYGLDTSTTTPSLVVTDPKFLRGKEVKGLDHMLERLDPEPQTTRKRLGDGHYESHVVSQQIVDLTGRPHLLPDATTTHGEFVALMDNGLSQAKGLQLRAGHALSGSQEAALPQPSVWPVQQQVTLPDGKKAAVLVPKVYLTKDKADSPVPVTSAVLSAGTLTGTLAGNLENSGTLMAERTLAITASGIENKGRVQTTGTGSSLNLTALKDLVHEGTIQGGRVELKAGQDLSMLASTSQNSGTNGSGTNIHRVATVAAETLVAEAGRDLKFVASQVQTTGDAILAAARKVVLDTLSTDYSKNLDYGRTYLHTSGTNVTGVRLDVGGSADVKAGGDFIATSAQVTAKQDLKASAGGSITLTTANQTNKVDAAAYSSGGSLFSSWSEQSRYQRETTTAVGNLFSGDKVQFKAGDRMTIKGSAVVGTGDVTLAAAGPIDIKAANHTDHTSTYSHREESGLMSSGGIGFTIGQREETHQGDDRRTLQSQVRSQVGTVTGSVSILSGDVAKVTGSDLIAGRNLDLKGKQVILDPGVDYTRQHERHEMRQTGLTLSLSCAAVTQAQGVVAHVQTAVDAKGDGRVLALNALAAETQRRDLARSAKRIESAQDTKEVASAAGVRVSAAIGTSRSESENTSHTRTHAGSGLLAKGNVHIAATESDLVAKGAAISGGTVTLEAIRDLKLTSAVDTTSTRGENRNSSGSLGVSFGVGNGRAGLSVDVNLSKGHGHSDGDGATHLDTVVTAQEGFTFRSGNDAKFEGARAAGKTVKGTVGGNLTLASKQDTFTFASSQNSAGLAASIPIYGAGGGASLSVNNAKATGDASSVREQTGLSAGEGGFQVTVAGHTDLKGAVLASAAPAGLNTLTTGTLSTSDLKNHSKGESTSSGFGLSTSVDTALGAATTALGALAGRGKADHDEASTTFSAIALGTLTVTDAKAQQALDGKTPAQAVAAVRRDTHGTHRALERPDMGSLEGDAATKHAANTLAFSTVVTYSEEAYKAAVNEGKGADLYLIQGPADPDANADEETRLVGMKITPEVRASLPEDQRKNVVLIKGLEPEGTPAPAPPAGTSGAAPAVPTPPQPEAPKATAAPVPSPAPATNKQETLDPTQVPAAKATTKVPAKGKGGPEKILITVSRRAPKGDATDGQSKATEAGGTAVQSDSKAAGAATGAIPPAPIMTMFPEDADPLGALAALGEGVRPVGPGKVEGDLFRGVASNLSGLLRDSADAIERAQNKVRGIGWVENREVPAELLILAKTDHARAEKLARDWFRDMRIASLPLMGCGGLTSLGLPAPSITIRMPGGPSAPAITTSGTAALPQAGAVTIPLPTGAAAMSSGPNHGGGKNAQHKNQDARDAAKAKYEEASARYRELESKANKTKQDRLDADNAKREMEHWKKKADETGENHSRTNKH